MLRWDDPISYIHSLSSYDRKMLKSLDAADIGELLNLIPRRYDDYSNLAKIADIPLNEPVTIKAKIDEIKQAPTFRRRFTLIRAKVSDASGSIGVTWFNQPWLLKQLKAGDEIFISGAVTMRPRFGKGFTSPLWEPADAETVAAGNIAPVYPLTGNVKQKNLRRIIRQALSELEPPEDWLDENIRRQTELPDLASAYRHIHAPESLGQTEQGRRRLAFDELLSYQLALRTARQEADAAGAPQVAFDENFAKKFTASLPFELTVDQKKAVWSAVQDMLTARPMRRLLQGDVGSGKTVVAAMLAALVHRSGQSAAIMAPTDILAKQHAQTLRRLLAPHHIPLVLLTSSARLAYQNGDERKLTPSEAREVLAQGRTVAVGTHALLVRGSAPPDLALAVIDEQHRFGVAQRETLVVDAREDGKVPHLLSMTATPIPRSLTLTMLGDLDVSIIRTKPIGRAKITTKVCVGDTGRQYAYDLIQEQVSLGRQAFIVCPLIDQSDKLGVKSVEEEVLRLRKGPLKDLKIGMVHGRLSNAEKDEAMGDFAGGATHVLVATTVVEVGVDVPNATVMLIEGAERFGLAQLHQLRGRVGRSSHESFCLLAASEDAGVADRLFVLERTDDGFKVAEEDLKIRGAGNILGLQQSGAPLFKAARPDDLELMAMAREISQEIVRTDPDLHQHPKIKQRIDGLRQTSHRE
ncbi:MAG: ATP-dependent DNA helicase RecG [Patescibacteria group bacterium]|nr:ATP-dependent DNA helicase RecG [Patescibacteria group bacterium]